MPSAHFDYVLGRSTIGCVIWNLSRRYVVAMLSAHFDYVLGRDDCEISVVGSSPIGGAKKKASRETCFFLSNPKDWYGITRRVHGIRRKATAWHTLCSPTVCTAALRAMFRQRRNARGAICARSFTSELADSLRLIITRQRVFFLRIDGMLKSI